MLFRSVVTQKGTELLTQNFEADDLGGNLKTIAINETEKVGIEGAVEVKVTLQTTVFDVNGPTNATEKPVTDARTTDTGDWVKENLEPGVYVLEGLPKDKSAGSPFDQNCDSRDTRTFVYPRTGKVVSYTLTITSKSGVLVYQETGSTCTDGSTENSIFKIGRAHV